jgi:hypothetical protein
LPYCRRCGTQLEDDARFCHKCGTPVVTYVPPAAYTPVAQPVQIGQHQPWRKDPYVIAAIGLVVILVSAALIVSLLVAPLGSWSLSDSFADSNSNVDTINLNFVTDIGRVNIATMEQQDSNIGIYVISNGSRGIIGGSSNIPVTITFDNQTTGNVLNVNSKVAIENVYTSRADLTCQIYVNPALKLNLNVTSTTGHVSFTADKATTIKSLNLQTTTGEVEANLQGNVTIAGDISLRTTTGAINYRMNENAVSGNHTINLQSTTGSVTLDITQTKTLSGNLQVNAAATTGSVNVGLIIDGGVSAKIASQKPALGNILTDLNNFQGNNTLLQSNNFPSNSIIEINNHAVTGNININANYKTTTIAS